MGVARHPRDKARVVERREGEYAGGAAVPGTGARADSGHGPGRQRRAARGRRRGLPPARGEWPLPHRWPWHGVPTNVRGTSDHRPGGGRGGVSALVRPPGGEGCPFPVGAAGERWRHGTPGPRPVCGRGSARRQPQVPALQEAGAFPGRVGPPRNGTSPG